MTQPSDLEGYLEGLARGELCGQRCHGCGEHQWPPRPACARCRGFDLEWVRLPAKATLHTWTVVHRTKLPGFEEKVPYAVGVLEYDALRVRVVGLLDADPDALEVGDLFTWSVNPSHDGSPQPVWRPATAGVAA